MQLYLINSGKKFNPIKLFFWIALFEIMIGGAGRVFAFGGLTLRMVFFVIIIASTLLLFFLNKAKTNKLVMYITVLYIFITLIAVFIGFVNSADKNFLIENVLMSSFFLTFPFFSMMIKSERDVQLVVKLLKASSLILAILYFLFLTILFLSIIPFDVLYEKVASNPEFAFRGNSALFYKGFFFMCCGFFFYINGKSKWNYLCAFVVIAAIFLTFIRGFAVAIISSYIIYLSFIKNIFWGILFSLLIIGLFPIVADYYGSVLGDRSESDQIRVMQLNQVKASITPFSFIMGMGYGNGIAVRPNHFEINFLEIFYKQGIIGLFFWMFLLGVITYKFFQVKNIGRSKEGAPFLLATFFLYIQSMSNPFLSNSIGMTFIFISYLCLDILSKKNKLIND
jgi:hypothetical protein